MIFFNTRFIPFYKRRKTSGRCKRQSCLKLTDVRNSGRVLCKQTDKILRYLCHGQLNKSKIYNLTIAWLDPFEHSLCRHMELSGYRDVELSSFSEYRTVISCILQKYAVKHRMHVTLYPQDTSNYMLICF